MDRSRSQVRAVVDTNVVAYFLLGTLPFVEETRQFWQAVGEAIAPAVWEAELANVVWMAIRKRVVPAEEGQKRLEFAGRLGIRSVQSKALWHGALSRAVESGLAVYDTLFVELAGREHVSLATFDSGLLSAFPAIAKRPGILVGTRPEPRYEKHRSAKND
jgi:predicted nucleic acid-binding protein